MRNSHHTNSSNSNNSRRHLRLTRSIGGQTWVGSSPPCSQIISSHTLALRSPTPAAQRHRLSQQANLLSMIPLLHNKQMLRRSVIHFREKRHPAGVVFHLEAVVRIRRRTEEAVGLTSGRGEPLPVVYRIKFASLVVSPSLSFVVITFAQCPAASLLSSCANFLYLSVVLSLQLFTPLPSFPIHTHPKVASKIAPVTTTHPIHDRMLQVFFQRPSSCRKDVERPSALRVSMV